MNNDLMSTETLATFVGLVAATSLIVQFTKSIIKKQLGDGYVRIYAFFIALILIFIFARNGDGLDGLQGIVLMIINAIMVTMSAMGSYEAIMDPMAKKVKR